MTAPTQECNCNCEADGLNLAGPYERCCPEMRGHPDNIRPGGPRRTEAKHPQPRFDFIGAEVIMSDD